MYYKDDWLKAKERLTAFWQGEMLDRCLVAVFAPRKTSKVSFPELQNGPWLGGLDDFSDHEHDKIKNWWTDPEENYKRAVYWFENTYFGGEAIPATYINWGAMAEAAFFGSEPIFTKNTVWYPEVIVDWEKWAWRFEKETNPWWNKILDIQKHFISNCNGRYLVGMPELGNAADLLSLMRGTDKLAIDLIENPREIKTAVDILGTTWCSLHEELFLMTEYLNDGGGVLPWMSLWAPGRHDQLACDFSGLISGSMFEEFFVPDIRRMGQWATYGTYHLDGPACMNTHLDTLLNIEEIKNIEWTYGIGSPPTYTPDYIPKYKKIQKAGKNLYLLAQKHEIEPLLSELSAQGLFLCTSADSQEEADDIIKNVEKWSVAR